jgi:hypothetical protein
MMTSSKHAELEQFEKQALGAACIPPRELTKANSLAIRTSPKLDAKEETKSRSPMPKIS